ncbi:MAG: tyrosine-type recombinase/integrase, partial [Solirubrobacterales bacterium]
GKKTLIVPMLPNLNRELEKWRKVTRFPKGSDLVFAETITGGPLEPRKVTKRFNKALLMAGVGPSEIREYKNNGKVYKRRHPLWEFRDLRDTFGSALMSNPNIAPREVQEAMGHANLSTTSARYGGFVPTTDLAERMSGSFGNCPSDVPQTSLNQAQLDPAETR